MDTDSRLRAYWPCIHGNQKMIVEGRTIRSWRERTATIKRNAEALMCAMMDREPDPDSTDMMPSDYADNIVRACDDLDEAINRAFAKPKPITAEKG